MLLHVDCGGGSSAILTKVTIPKKLHTLSHPTHPTCVSAVAPVVQRLKALKPRASNSSSHSPCIPNTQENVDCKHVLDNSIVKVFQGDKILTTGEAEGEVLESSLASNESCFVHQSWEKFHYWYMLYIFWNNSCPLPFVHFLWAFILNL